MLWVGFHLQGWWPLSQHSLGQLGQHSGQLAQVRCRKGGGQESKYKPMCTQVQKKHVAMSRRGSIITAEAGEGQRRGQLGQVRSGQSSDQGDIGGQLGQVRYRGAMQCSTEQFIWKSRSQEGGGLQQPGKVKGRGLRGWERGRRVRTRVHAGNVRRCRCPIICTLLSRFHPSSMCAVSGLTCRRRASEQQHRGASGSGPVPGTGGSHPRGAAHSGPRLKRDSTGRCGTGWG